MVPLYMRKSCGDSEVLLLFSYAGGFSLGEDRRLSQLGGEHEAEPPGLLHRADRYPQADGCHTCMSVVIINQESMTLQL